jgi:hypothetical protein
MSSTVPPRISVAGNRWAIRLFTERSGCRMEVPRSPRAKRLHEGAKLGEQRLVGDRSGREAWLTQRGEGRSSPRTGERISGSESHQEEHQDHATRKVANV